MLTDIKQLLSRDVYNALVGANSPSASNVYATINDLTGFATSWASSLAIGNISGGNNALMTAGDIIGSTSGSAFIDLAYGGANSLLLSNDGYTGNEGYLTMAGGGQPGTSLGFGGNYFLADGTNSGIYASIGFPFPSQSGYFNAIGSSVSLGLTDIYAIGVVVPSFISPNTLSVSFTNTGGYAFSSIISSPNSVINTGVKHSVILGGNAITAKTINTAYLMQAGFVNSGFEAIFKSGTLTADRIITLPDASGTVMLAGAAWTAANMLTLTDAIGGSGLIETSINSTGSTLGFGTSAVATETIKIIASDALTTSYSVHIRNNTDTIDILRIDNSRRVIIGNGSIGGGATLFNVNGESHFSQETSIRATSGQLSFKSSANGARYSFIKGDTSYNITFYHNPTTPIRSMSLRGTGEISFGTPVTIVPLPVTGGNALVNSVGDIAVATVGKGYVVKSPDGTAWRITVDNTGAITTALA